MRKVVLQMMTTLNGRLDDPNAWVSGVSDDLFAEIDRVYGTFDTILLGQATYAEMFAYWPDAETDASGSEITRRMGRKMNAYKKYVFTHADVKTALEWNNAEQALVHGDDELISFVNWLKAQPGANIHLAGGARLAQSMIRLCLVDEYQLFVYPTVSPGAAWFDAIADKRDMELLSATPYENGVVGLYYRLARG